MRVVRVGTKVAQAWGASRRWAGTWAPSLPGQVYERSFCVLDSLEAAREQARLGL
jgi:hypothetical protein